MRTISGMLGLLLTFNASGRADPPKPSLADDLTSLQGKWETDTKAPVKATLEVKTAGKAKTRIDLDIGPKPKLKVIDDEVALKEVGGKRVIAWSEVIGELGGQADVEYTLDKNVLTLKVTKGDAKGEYTFRKVVK